MQYSPSEWSGKFSKTMQDICIPLHCLPELYGKTPSQNILYTLVIGHGENKLVLAMKLSPSWLAFLVLEWTAEEKSSTILLSYETNNLHNEQHNISRPIF